MASRSHEHLLQEIRKIGAAVRAEGLPDAALLERFTVHRDETAFTALVRRHGPLVLSVCRRVLRHDADAEDAWQATFLVLARRAGSIRRQGSLGSWLHGTAYRIAAHLRRDLARRHARESLSAGVPEAPAPETSWREVQEILDEELGRLPETLRLPVVLCYLEGKTRDEAAGELGWSLSTLRGRLERARERLRGRLTRRGVTLSAALLASLVARDAISGVVPSNLVSTAVHAAALTSAGQPVTGVVSARVLALTEGVVQTMRSTRMLLAAGLLLALGFVGVGLFARQEPREEKGAGPVLKKEQPAKPQPTEPKPAADPAAAAEEEFPPWSKPSNGLRGRLTAVRKEPFYGTPILAVYLELQNVSNQSAAKELPVASWELEYTVTDGEGKNLPSVSGPYDEIAVPPVNLLLPNDATIRLNVTHHGAGVQPNQGGHLDLGAIQQWNFPRNDSKTYFIRAKLSTREVKGNVWTGSLDLPKVELPLKVPVPGARMLQYTCEFIQPADAVKLLAAIYRDQKGFAVTMTPFNGLMIRGQPETIKEIKKLLVSLDLEVPAAVVLPSLKGAGHPSDKEREQEIRKALEKLQQRKK